MIEKLKFYKDKLSIVLSIVACALLVPTFFSYIGASFTEYNVFHLIRYCLLIAANCIIFVTLFFNKKLDNNILMISLITFILAPVVINIYALVNNDFSAIAYLSLYISVGVFYFISKRNAVLKKVFYLLLLIALAFFVASALSGGAIALSVLITALVVFGNIYLLNEEKK